MSATHPLSQIREVPIEEEIINVSKLSLQVQTCIKTSYTVYPLLSVNNYMLLNKIKSISSIHEAWHIFLKLGHDEMWSTTF
jgi:hypothetical protein